MKRTGPLKTKWKEVKNWRFSFLNFLSFSGRIGKPYAGGHDQEVVKLFSCSWTCFSLSYEKDSRGCCLRTNSLVILNDGQICSKISKHASLYHVVRMFCELKSIFCYKLSSPQTEVRLRHSSSIPQNFCTPPWRRKICPSPQKKHNGFKGNMFFCRKTCFFLAIPNSLYESEVNFLIFTYWILWYPFTLHLQVAGLFEFCTSSINDQKTAGRTWSDQAKLIATPES